MVNPYQKAAQKKTSRGTYDPIVGVYTPPSGEGKQSMAPEDVPEETDIKIDVEAQKDVREFRSGGARLGGGTSTVSESVKTTPAEPEKTAVEKELEAAEKPEQEFVKQFGEGGELESVREIDTGRQYIVTQGRVTAVRDPATQTTYSVDALERARERAEARRPEIEQSTTLQGALSARPVSIKKPEQLPGQTQITADKIDILGTNGLTPQRKRARFDVPMKERDIFGMLAPENISDTFTTLGISSAQEQRKTDLLGRTGQELTYSVTQLGLGAKGALIDFPINLFTDPIDTTKSLVTPPTVGEQRFLRGAFGRYGGGLQLVGALAATAGLGGLAGRVFRPKTTGVSISLGKVKGELQVQGARAAGVGEVGGKVLVEQKTLFFPKETVSFDLKSSFRTGAMGRDPSVSYTTATTKLLETGGKKPIGTSRADVFGQSYAGKRIDTTLKTPTETTRSVSRMFGTAEGGKSKIGFVGRAGSEQLPTRVTNEIMGFDIVESTSAAFGVLKTTEGKPQGVVGTRVSRFKIFDVPKKAEGVKIIKPGKPKGDFLVQLQKDLQRQSEAGASLAVDLSAKAMEKQVSDILSSETVARPTMVAPLKIEKPATDITPEQAFVGTKTPQKDRGLGITPFDEAGIGDVDKSDIWGDIDKSGRGDIDRLLNVGAQQRVGQKGKQEPDRGIDEQLDLEEDVVPKEDIAPDVIIGTAAIQRQAQKQEEKLITEQILRTTGRPIVPMETGPPTKPPPFIPSFSPVKNILGTGRKKSPKTFKRITGYQPTLGGILTGKKTKKTKDIFTGFEFIRGNAKKSQKVLKDLL